jgi:glucose 1-dehydrogenase
MRNAERGYVRLEGRVAIVTGAGRGIGRAIAQGLAREGAAIIVNYSRSAEQAEDLVSRIRASGGRAEAVEADIKDLNDHDRLVSAALEHFGSLNILVNNAGMEIHEPFLKASVEAWDLTLGVNLKGPYFLSRKAAEAMIRFGSGKIVNISSVHDVEPLRQRAIYSISKGGMMMMTKSLALELGEYKINVNSISPGAILTDMNRKSLSEPGNLERVLNKIPWKRIGEAEDVVGAAVYLASSESDYVTGSTIYVDGGLLLT